ncbi:hypothetical protein OSB04_021627 [Centaurea solstitialis]|uniref:Auxin efflux carrier component n=1 Tax=Centaurea solstitialis TaxID=347529 RepID=A0AA38SW65_9ASTR|nr:hypothetical protein OSB04_021627 [Centaurea solstitialis]
MITGNDFYSIVKAMVPLYVAMFLAYGSVRWWKIFTPDQCSGINRFVAIFAVPFLSFHFISMNDPYSMNFRFLAADTLQKIIILVGLAVLMKFTKFVTLEWVITMFSLTTLPNTLVMGVPLLTAMFGDFSASLMIQVVLTHVHVQTQSRRGIQDPLGHLVVVLQGIIWYTLLLFLCEFRAARTLIMERFPESGAAIASFKVDSDVISLDGQDVLETEAAVGEDGKLHVRVRKSNASRRSFGVGSLSGVEIYSLSSSAIQTPRGSNVNQSDFYSITGFPGGRLSNFGPAVDSSVTLEEEPGPVFLKMTSSRSGMYHAAQNMTPYFQAVNSDFIPAVTKPQQPSETPSSRSKPQMQNKVSPDGHVFPRSSSAPIGSKGGRLSSDFRPPAQHGANETRLLVSDHPQNGKVRVREQDKPVGLESTVVPEEGSGTQMPSATIMIRLILVTVWRKLIRNPNTYASILGLIWSLVSFRWDVGMPKIIGSSITLISNTGLGMAMFSLGLFMALQPKMIGCGRSKALIATIARFLIGPLVMVVASFAVGLRGTLLRLAIVQASLSEGIVPFVFAKEYNVYPTILSFSVIFGMLITVPINLVYYIILEH